MDAISAIREQTVKTARAQEAAREELYSVKNTRPTIEKDGFWVTRENWELLRYSISMGIPSMIVGPSGQGKSTLVRLAAASLGRDFEAINFGGMQYPRLSLLGKSELVADESGQFNVTKFKEADFARFIQRDRMVLLCDEVTRLTYQAQNILLPLLDDQRMIRIDEADTPYELRRHPGCSIVATANMGAKYRGTQSLDNAFEERFCIHVNMPFPDAETEYKITEAQIKLATMREDGTCLWMRDRTNQKFVESLCVMAGEQRAQNAKGLYARHISTRMVIGCARARVEGVSVKGAICGAILNKFSDEGGTASDRIKLTALAAKFFPQVQDWSL